MTYILPYYVAVDQKTLDWKTACQGRLNQWIAK